MTAIDDEFAEQDAKLRARCEAVRRLLAEAREDTRRTQRELDDAAKAQRQTARVEPPPAPENEAATTRDDQALEQAETTLAALDTLEELLADGKSDDDETSSSPRILRERGTLRLRSTAPSTTTPTWTALSVPRLPRKDAWRALATG